MGRDIAVDIAGDGVATLTLARPERRNALSIQLRDQIAAQLEQWAREPAVRVVVLSAAASSFCAGFDLAEFAPAGLARRIRDSSRRYHLAVRAFPKPLLAAVNGPALAGRLGRRGVRASGDQVRRPAAVSRAFSQPSANPQ